MNLTDNTILITGGSSGIGRALAEAFHDRGNRVIITGRQQASLDEIIGLRPGIEAMLLDLNDSEGVRRFAIDVRERFPALNVLITNAGISRAEDMTTTTGTCSMPKRLSTQTSSACCAQPLPCYRS